MQVQLIIANEHRKGQAIPVYLPSFMIGRAEGCNLRSRSPQVSRYHCVIHVNDNIVTVQDLGGGNGTFINGNRVTSVQTLKDGDTLTIGTHSFIVSVKAGMDQPAPETNQSNPFELTSSSVLQSQSQSEQSATQLTTPNVTAIAAPPAKKPEPEAEIMFEIRLDGQRISVTKNRLFDLARKGALSPDDLVTVAGTKVFADSIQGIVFGDKSSAAPTSSPSPPPPNPSAPTSSGIRPPTPSTAATPVVPDSDPFAFPDLGGITDESNPFNVASEPFVRVGRKESAFGALWKALDISFSRVYTLEGNNLVIHSIKALYYVIVVVCLLSIFFPFINFCADWYKSGDLLKELQLHYVALSVVTFGCVTIIVIVRVLLEMLLLAWFESATEDRETKENE